MSRRCVSPARVIRRRSSHERNEFEVLRVWRLVREGFLTIPTTILGTAVLTMHSIYMDLVESDRSPHSLNNFIKYFMKKFQPISFLLFLCLSLAPTIASSR